MQSLGSRIRYVREQVAKLTQKGFSEAIGANSAMAVSHWENDSRSADITILVKISQMFDIRLEWLATGNGDINYPNREDKGPIVPQVVTTDYAGRDNVVLVGAKAAAGYLRGFGDPVYVSTLPTYYLPNLGSGTYRMFEVSGESMFPTLKDSDLVVCEWIQDFRQIRDDRVHVIVTHDGLLVKRVLNRVAQEGKLVAKSDNMEGTRYPALVIRAEDVKEVWYVRMYVSRQLMSPANYWERLANLEGEVTTLKEQLKDVLKRIQ